MPIIVFLNDNEGAMIVVFTFCLVCITAWYVYETRKIRKNANSPEIKVALLYSHREINRLTIDLYIQNIGTGYAYDIHFFGSFTEFKPALTEKMLGEYEIIKHGIRNLGPGRRYQTPVVWDCKRQNLPKDKHNIVVTYRDSPKKKRFIFLRNKYEKREYTFDFERTEGFIEMGDPSLDNIAVSLRSIQKDLSKIKKKYASDSGSEVIDRVNPS